MTKLKIKKVVSAADVVGVAGVADVASVADVADVAGVSDVADVANVADVAKNIDSPELLAPAGDMDKLKAAVAYGADAVYMGMASFSMRSKSNNFDEKSFLEGVKYARAAGKKVYVTVNVYPRSNKIEAFRKHLKFLRDKVKPDALIIADPGLIQLSKEVYPEAVLHLSVQANALNYKAVEFWVACGVKRVILPRELMLEEIREIHEKVPEVEIEVFVHGAICVAYSGRCLLSYYMTGRDANQGICAQSCRWKYKVSKFNGGCADDGRDGGGGSSDCGGADDGRDGVRVEGCSSCGGDKGCGMAASGEHYLEEEMRPGEFMPIEEDSHGTYIMNSKDNCLIEYLKDLRDAGVCSFKIEGRNKTIYYLAVVVKTYRKAISDMMVGKKFDKELLKDLMKISNRGYIPGFMKGFPGNDNIYPVDSSPESLCRFIGVIRECGCLGQDDLYRVEMRNRIEVGEKIEVLGSKSVSKIVLEEILNLNGETVPVAHGGDKDVYFRLKKGLQVLDLIRV